MFMARVGEVEAECQGTSCIFAAGHITTSSGGREWQCTAVALCATR